MAVEMYFAWGQSSASVAAGETVSVPVTADIEPSVDKLSALFSPYAVVDSATTSAVVIRGVSAGSITVPMGRDIAPQSIMDMTTYPSFTLTVTAPVEDESYLNKRGLTHFWENIDNLKQDKLTVGSNITISDENVISAVQPTVDSSLSFSSTNAVENQAIKNTIYNKNSSNDKEAGVNIEFSNPTLSPYVHIGSKSTATKGNSSVGIGYDAESSAVRSVAIGPSATVTKREGVALGANATAGQYSLSIGYYTNTVPNYSTAVGPYAKVLTGATNATAIGYQSEASEAETISVGKSTNKRRIVNVADGTTATDAATVGQIPVVITDEEIDSIVESS